MTIKVADEKQGKLVNILKDLNKSVTPVQKIAFLNNLGLFLSAKKNFYNNCGCKVFPIKKYKARRST